MIGYPAFEEDNFYGAPALRVCCPVCGFDYARHAAVVTFDREEDGPTVVRINGARTTTTIPNPSPRRDAVRICFTGECGHAWGLDVIQHKGQTYLVQRPKSD